MSHRIHSGFHPAFIALALWLGAFSFGCAPAYDERPMVEGWNDEDAYWHHHYLNEPYYTNGYGYEVYQPAYLYGYEAFDRYHGQRFEELNDAELRTQWQNTHGRGSRLDWAHAREAARAAYNRRQEVRAGIPPRPGTQAQLNARAAEIRAGIPPRPGM